MVFFTLLTYFKIVSQTFWNGKEGGTNMHAGNLNMPSKAAEHYARCQSKIKHTQPHLSQILIF